MSNLECPPISCNLEIIAHVLKFASEITQQTVVLSRYSDELLLLPEFEIKSIKTGAQYTIEIPKAYKHFYYFGEGNADCLFDDIGNCLPVGFEMSDKIVVLTACDQAQSYARQAVRDYNAAVCFAYASPLVVQFTDQTNTEFRDGFKESFLNIQKVLLSNNAMSAQDEETFELALSDTKRMYESWGDYYNSMGDAFAANLFYANSLNLLKYSINDVPVSVSISSNPTGAEIWDFGVYTGNTPLTHSTISGGHIYQIKAIGCFLQQVIDNIPKEGKNYTLTPTVNFERGYRSYDIPKMYMEYDNQLNASPIDGTAPTIGMYFYNYSDSDINKSDIPITTSGSMIDWIGVWSNPPLGKVEPHTMYGNQYRLEPSSRYTLGSSPYIDTLTCTIETLAGKDTFDIQIFIPPEIPTAPTVISVKPLLQSFPELTGLYDQYNKMTEDEKNEKRIVIFPYKEPFSYKDIIYEISRHSEVGQLFLRMAI